MGREELEHFSFGRNRMMEKSWRVAALYWLQWWNKLARGSMRLDPVTVFLMYRHCKQVYGI